MSVATQRSSSGFKFGFLSRLSFESPSTSPTTSRKPVFKRKSPSPSSSNRSSPIPTGPPPQPVMIRSDAWIDFELPPLVEGTMVCDLNANDCCKGGYASVYKAEWTRPSGEKMMVALKELDVDPRKDSDETLQKRLTRECHVQKRLHHPNVLPLLGLWRDPEPERGDGDNSFKFPKMVMPYCEKGHLVRFIDGLKRREMAGTITQKESLLTRLRLVREISDGLLYIHGLDVIHQDLYPQNILIDDADHACIADFGFARIKNKLGSTTVSQPDVDNYRLPEGSGCFEAGDTSHATGTKAGDLYQFGLIAYYIMTGKNRKESLTNEQYCNDDYHPPNRERSQPLDEARFDGFWEACGMCWAKNPSARATIEVVHPRLAEKIPGLEDD